MTSRDVRDLERIGWELAIAEAVGGSPDYLAQLLREGAPPADLCPAIADVVLRIPRTKRPTRSPRFAPHEANQIREAFIALTTADPESPRRWSALSDTAAREVLAEKTNVNPDTIRDVVERKKAYRR